MRIALLVFLPLLSAPAVYGLGRRNERLRDNAACGIAALSLILSLSLLPEVGRFSLVEGVPPAWYVRGIQSLGVAFAANGFRVVYSIMASLMWLATSLFSKEYFLHEREGLNAYWAFTLMTLGATQGVMLSADLMTTYVFFEILSLTSFTWVMHERTAEAIRAGCTYLFIAVTGALILLMGLILLQDTCGTLEYAALRTAAADAPQGRLLAAGICILIGFGAKAGMFPVHVWLPMAHPVAPSPASALLSGVLTKVGVFGILMTAAALPVYGGAYGMLILCLGLVTMLLGAVLALFSVNLKRTLACSSMSQIGFILVGIGSAVLCGLAGEAGEAGMALALSGTVLHMVNHSLFKLVLFMAAGVVLMNLHALTLDEIRGWGRNKPLLHFVFAVGALGISGVPLLNGYLSKSMLHEGLVHLMEEAEAGGIALPFEAGAFLHGAEWVFLFSGGCTFAYMLKLYLCLFHEKNAKKVQTRFQKQPVCMNHLSSAVLLVCAVLLIPLGQPWAALRLAHLMTGTHPHFAAFAWENLRGAAVSLGIGAVVYLGFVRRELIYDGRYVNLWPAGLDLEGRLYRPLFTRWLPGVFGPVAAVFAENRILRPVCAGGMFLGTLAARILSDSMDALVVFLRRTAVREVKRLDSPMRFGRFRILYRAVMAAMAPTLETFSFTLLMTCFGVILILGLLILLVL